MKKGRWIFVMLALLTGLLMGCGQTPQQTNVFEEGRTVVNAELTRIVFVSEGLICGYDDEHSQKFYLSFAELGETNSLEQKTSKLRYSGEIVHVNDVNIHINIMNINDVVALEFNRDPEVDREETQEELDQALMERAVEADFEAMMSGDVEEYTSVYLTGVVSDIGEGGRGGASFIVSDGQASYYVDTWSTVFARLENILSEVEEGVTTIKLYGSFDKIDDVTGLPYIDGRIIEIIE